MIQIKPISKTINQANNLRLKEKRKGPGGGGGGAAQSCTSTTKNKKELLLPPFESRNLCLPLKVLVFPPS